LADFFASGNPLDHPINEAGGGLELAKIRDIEDGDKSERGRIRMGAP
jgi:hypothetical protein